MTSSEISKIHEYVTKRYSKLSIADIISENESIMKQFGKPQTKRNFSKKEPKIIKTSSKLNKPKNASDCKLDVDGKLKSPVAEISDLEILSKMNWADIE